MNALLKVQRPDEGLVLQVMQADLSLADQQAWLDDAAERVRRDGVVIVRNAVPRHVLAAVVTDFERRHDVHMAPGQNKLFRRNQSDPRRAQFSIAIDGPVADPQLFAAPTILALMRRLMGEDVVVGEAGSVIAHPGADRQEVHRDSKFLFGGVDEEFDLPPFSMNVLIPLVDVSLEMGPTEFWPGSHRVRDEATASAGPPQRLAMEAGTVALFDSRIVHRGGANISGPVRPVVYFCYHRPWYLETYGYDNKPQVRITLAMWRRLPQMYQPLFKWALHLNRTVPLDEFIYRWIGRGRRFALKVLGR